MAEIDHRQIVCSGNASRAMRGKVSDVAVGP
jgi:hypothetical protein